MLALIAKPKAIAFLTASWFKTGSEPGWPVQTSEILVLGSSPKRLGAVEKSLVLVLAQIHTVKSELPGNFSSRNSEKTSGYLCKRNH